MISCAVAEATTFDSIQNNGSAVANFIGVVMLPATFALKSRNNTFVNKKISNELNTQRLIIVFNFKVDIL